MSLAERAGIALVALSLCVSQIRPAQAWGPNGHAIVADIAASRLTPAVQRKVSDLLALEGYRSLDQIASWPDTIGHISKEKGGAPETLVWHYVDIDINDSTFDAARDCPQGNCVVARLPEMIRLLADKSAPQAKRLWALKWVVHLVGDLHQPLHASERSHDKGGNAVAVDYFGDTRGGHLNLHSLWDEKILERETGLAVGPHYSIDYGKAHAEADILEHAITPEEVAKWTSPNVASGVDAAVEGWVMESHDLAKNVVYAGVAPTAQGSTPDVIGQAYEKKAWPVVQMRLQQAGVRLAEVLNQALGSNS